MTLTTDQPTDIAVAMAARVDSVALRQGLAAIKPAVDKRPSLPVLGGVRITVDGATATATLAATDLDLALETTIDATFATAGSVVVPFDRLERFVSDATVKNRQPLTLTVAGDDVDNVAVSEGRTVVNLRTLPIDEWPHQLIADPGVPGNEAICTVDADAIAEVVAFTYGDDARPILCAVYIEGDRVVATDSYRIGLVTDLPDTGVKALIPGRAAALLGRIGGSVAAEFGARYARFITRDLTITTRLQEGDFPNYHGLLPDSVPCRYTGEIADLAAALHHVTKKFKLECSTPVRLEGDSEGVRFVARTQDVGDVGHEFPGTFHGYDGAVAYNPVYLKTVLDIPHPDLGDPEFGWIDSLKPSILRQDRYLPGPKVKGKVSSWTPAGRRVRLIMPIRVS